MQSEDVLHIPNKVVHLFFLNLTTQIRCMSGSTNGLKCMGTDRHLPSRKQRSAMLDLNLPGPLFSLDISAARCISRSLVRHM